MQCEIRWREKPIRKAFKYILKPLALIYGKRRAISNLNHLAVKYDYDTAKYVGAITWGLYGISEKMLKKDVDKNAEVMFEGEIFSSFSCWKYYLENLYGDYMQLPPPEKRINHEMIVWTDDE